MTTLLLASSLLHFLWQGAVIGLIAAAVLRAMDRSTPQSRYLVACGFLLLMAASPVATFLLLMSGEQAAALPTPLLQNSALSPNGGAPIFPAVSAWQFIVLAIWMAGVALFAARTLGGWAFAMKRLSARRTSARQSVQAAADRIAKLIGIRSAVRVFESSVAAVPTVYGAFKPIILLPASVVTGLPADQLEAILAHELAHVARHDFLVNCLQSAIETLLYYHPAVWRLSNRIRMEREMCCDAMAADLCGDRVLYSRALLSLEEARHQEPALAATGGGDLQSRIERLLGIAPQQRRLPAIAPSALAIVALFACATVAMVYAQNSRQQADSPYQNWVSEDVVYIISQDERQAWDRLTADDARKRFIEQFWIVRDPSPGTEANEAKVEHYRRIRYSIERFASPTRKGWATARGRTYIVHGPPDQIESHPSDLRENWRYRNGLEFEFKGSEYELARRTDPPVAHHDKPRVDVTEKKLESLADKMHYFVMYHVRAVHRLLGH